MEIQIKKLRPEAVLPTRGSAQAAGYDLYACLPEGEIVLHTKQEKVEQPPHHEGPVGPVP